jgi:hypothetical protein
MSAAGFSLTGFDFVRISLTLPLCVSKVFGKQRGSDLQASTLSAPIVAARSGFGAGAIGGSFRRAIHEEKQFDIHLLVGAVSDGRCIYVSVKLCHATMCFSQIKKVF